MKKVSLGKVEKFLKGELQEILREDLLHYRIFKEADLECCIYFHLRNHLKDDKRWRIFGRKHSRRTGHYIDLLIYKRYTPCVAIELKWRTSKLDGKDRRSLAKAVAKLKVKKTYFFSALPDEVKYVRSKKLIKEKWKLFEFVVGLGFTGTDRLKHISQWEKHRKKFRN